MSIVKSFGNVRIFDILAASEIGDGAGDLDDFEIGAGGKGELIGGGF